MKLATMSFLVAGFAATLAAPPARAAAPIPADATDPHPPALSATGGVGGPDTDQDPLTDLSAVSGLPLEDYADDLDYDVTYDDAVAARYDDGYAPDAYEQFESALAPHGTWVDDPAYGRVWLPSPAEVGDNFTPYATNGDWLDTEYGWTWSSGWSWGWAPFHYGRWVCLDRGWAWVPGTLWGPAWVAWRAGGGYVGWAPMPPHGVTLGTPIGMHSPWRFMAASELGRPGARFLSPRLVPSAFPRTTIVANTRVLPDGGTNVRVNAGPPMGGVAGSLGAPRVVRLAAAAPGALPRLVIQPHLGSEVWHRPWVMAGETTQLPRYGRVRSRFADPQPARVLASGGGGWRAPVRGAGGFGVPRATVSAGREARDCDTRGIAFAPVFSALPSSSVRHGASSAPGFTAPVGGFTAAPPAFTAPAPLLFSAPSSARAQVTYARPSAVAPPFHGGSHGAGGRHR